MSPDWSFTQYHPVFAEEVPRSSGVYAVLRVSRSSGIPVSSEVLYVGKSRDLRKRFRGHTDPYRQHNRALNALSHEKGLEFWYSPVNAAELDAAERKLIRDLNPVTNVLRYRDAHH
jgi:excinuclease UvrABC nuclease subunit